MAALLEGEHPEAILANRYRVDRLLGRGGMGSVYAATDLELDEIVAVKLLTEDASDDGERAIDRLRLEVRLARKVTHPNVARTFDLGSHGQRRFLTMELVDGASLRELLAGKELTRASLLAIAEQIATGLVAIHEQGIVHRDLKPENVLVSKSGVAKISDFGIALSMDAAPRSTAGTPRYMAPELLRGQAPTAAADVYALGLLVYDVLTVGQVASPRAAPDTQLLSGPARSFVERCLADDPRARPTAKEAQAEIAALRDEAPVTITFGHRSRSLSMRVGVAAFATQEPGDAYIGTSLAADVHRILVEAPELALRAGLLPSGTVGEVLARAREDELRAVVIGNVRHAGNDDVSVSMRVVAVDDALQIWARSFTAPMSSILGELEDAAVSLTRALDVHERPTALSLHLKDRDLVELYLRASEAEHRPWAEWENSAPEFFRQALERAPDDPVLLASYAVCLLRGAPPYDRTRYLTARRAAEQALVLNTRSAAPHLACGASLYLANDAVGAVEALRRALALAPSLADGHAMLGAIASAVGLLDESVGRSQLALALDPRIAIARFCASRSLEMKGDRAGADVMLRDGLRDTRTFGAFLCALSTARYALWRGTDEARDAAVEMLRPAAAGNPLSVPLIGFLRREVPIDVIFTMLDPLTSASVEWGRQRELSVELRAELYLVAGEDDKAIALVGELVEVGSYDATWFELCPLVARIAAHPATQRVSQLLAERAKAVREALWSLSAP